MPVWASAFANLLVAAIQGTLQADIDGRLAAIQAAVQSTQSLAADIRNAVLNLALALLNIAAKIDALQNSVNGLSLLLLENGVAQADQFSSLTYQISHPILPPSGGGGDVASEVWNYRPAGEDRPMGYWMLNSGKLALNIGNSNAQFGSQGSPLVGVTAYWNQDGPEIRGVSAPAPDINAIGAYGTVLEWLVATSGRDDWELNPQGYYWCGASLGDTAFSFWVCRLSQWEFDFLKGVAPSAALIGAPVWPGLASVTLGDVLTLTDGMTVDGPLHGVIINISAVPPPTGFYGFGSRKSYVHIGAIVFISDNGDAEHSETIGLDSQVISVRGMTRASSAVLRVKSGTVGTVQPWTITA